MSNEFVWHPGTGTYINLNECIIVDVPNNVVDIETYLKER
jgi:hypothetical protein